MRIVKNEYLLGDNKDKGANEEKPTETINNKINNNKRKLNDIMARNIFKNPMIIYEKKELYFDSILERLKFSLKSLTSAKEKELIKVKNSYILKNPHQLLEKKGNKYLQLVSKLETLSPLLTLQRGYTMTKKEGKVITKSTDVKKKDIIEIVFSDGSVNAEIK